MIGAILGDIIGSPYEFDRGNKSKEFPLFSRESTYTDDTVMTLAVSLTFLDAQPSASDDWILQNLAMALQCVFLQLRGYITISMLSDTQQGFQLKLPTIIRKESRVLKQLPVLFFWQGQDMARQKLRNIWNMNLVMN